MALTDDDRRQLEAHGITPAEAERQLALLANPPGFARLERPCTPGDGIEVLDAGRVASLASLAVAAAASGRLAAFVPSSGAATRMFKELLAWLGRPGDLPRSELDAACSQGDADARAVAAFADALGRFAFWPALAEAIHAAGGDPAGLREQGPLRPVIEALLGSAGLGYADRPKGLLAFHRDGGRARTAFEEHLREATQLVRDERGVCRLHVTVSPEHLTGFEAELADVRVRLADSLGARWDVNFSEQRSATDTVAAAPGGGPFRGADGRLVLRPAGHGALLANLAQSEGDLVLLKNIDNVTVDARREPTLRWSRALLGRLLELEEQVSGWLERLHAGDPAAPEPALAFARSTFGAEARAGQALAAARASAIGALERPIRVCGMVRNTGEPGGGPFWVRGESGGVSAQIVESAQVDPAASDQQAVAKRATHFNPVFLVCALRDRNGRAWDLDRFVDPRAVIVAKKSSGGRELLALERPGLWNGAMAHWNTVFVEVPLEVFNPVKSVLDLLRPEHQGV